MEGECRCDLCFVPFAARPTSRLPIALQCHHTACAGCVEGLEPAPPNHRTIECPLCGGTTSKRAGGEWNVRHAALDDGSDASDEGEGGEEEQEGQEGQREVLCTAHHVPCDLVCLDDLEAVCAVCAQGGHAHHNVAAPGVAAGLLGRVVEGVGDVLRQTRATEAQARAARAHVMSACADTEARINAHFDELERHRHRLLEQVRHERKRVCQRLNDVRSAGRILQRGLAELSRHAHQATMLSGRALALLREVRELARSTAGLRLEPAVLAKFDFAMFPSVQELRARCRVVHWLHESKWEVPAQPSARELAPLPTPRFNLATLAVHDRVYVVGGASSGQFHGKVECLDLSSGEWEEQPLMPIPRESCAACVLDEKLVVVGGRAQGGYVTSVHAFDLHTRQWEALPALPHPRGGCGVVAHDGVLLAVGGSDIVQYQNSVFALVRGARSWTELGPMQERRGWFATARCGRFVYVCGGRSVGLSSLRTCERCDLGAVVAAALAHTVQDREASAPIPWQPVAQMPRPVAYCQGASAGGNVFVFETRTLLVLDVEQEAWREVPLAVQPRKRGGLACIPGLRRLVVLGGIHEHGSELVTSVAEIQC